MIATHEYENPPWREVALGVWSAQAGTPEEYTLLSAAWSEPRTEAIGKLPRAEFPFDPAAIRVECRRGKIHLRFPLEAAEEIYGLGLDFNGVRRNQHVQRLHADAWSGRSG